MVHELNKILKGGKIDKVQQPDPDEIRLVIRNNGGNHTLVLSANSSTPRVHLTDEQKENPLTAPAFCMFLRKHLAGAKVVGFSQPQLERVICLTAENYDELGDLTQKHLYAEIMGRHSNLILVSAEGKVLDARQGKILAESIDLKGRFQKFGISYTPAESLIETNSNIEFDKEEEKTLDMFSYVSGYYVAQKDMTAYIKVTVCANTIEEGKNKLYAAIQYTPVGGTEGRWLEDVSYGTFTSITMSGVKNVKAGDKFRILNLENVYVDSGFPCRPSGIEIIHM
jgi:predicted ribosome quality control (RQC) complex YloA/Tae2 family protein